VKIDVMDGGTYTEDLTINSTVFVDASSATLVGTVDVIGDLAGIHLAKHFAAANNDVMIQKSGGSSVGKYVVGIVDGRGTGGSLTGVDLIRNVSSGSVLVAMLGTAYIGEDGIGVVDGVTGVGRIHFSADALFLAGDDAIGIQLSNANSEVVGRVSGIRELGTPTGTLALSVGHSSANLSLVAAEVVADTAYNISAGSLYLTCPRVSGTRTGTPSAEISNLTLRSAAAVLGDLSVTGTVTLTTALPLTQGGTGATTAKGAVTNFLTVVDNAGTSITLADSDSGTVLRCTAATAVTIEVPSTLAAGFSVLIIQQGAGQVTITAGGGATLQAAGSRVTTVEQYSVASVIRVASATYNVSGDLEA
jgi:hypothetical protein